MKLGLNRVYSVFRPMGLGVLILALVACGGGGGGGGETADVGGAAETPLADVAYLTTNPAVDEVGESQRFNFSGTATYLGNPESVTGSVTTTHKPNQQYDGEEVQAMDVVLVLSLPSSGTTVSFGNTTLSKLNTGEMLILTRTDGVECYPDSNFSRIPESVRIGESGVLGSASCSDGTTMTGSYLVEQSTRNSNWAAVIVYSTVSTPGSADIYQDMTYHYPVGGGIQAIDIVSSDGSLMLDLRS